MTSAKKTILIVDDDPDILMQLGAILRTENYNVEAAHDAAEAEEVLLRVRPDLAVVDLMMEKMDSGFMLCHQIKKLYPGTPVLMLTAVKASTGISFPAGAGGWLEIDLMLDKPLRPEQLTAGVRRLLKAAAKPAKAKGA